MKGPTKLFLFGGIAFVLSWLCLSPTGPLQPGFFDGFIGRSSNWGGNSAALTLCKVYSLTVRLMNSNSLNSINLVDLPMSNKTEIVKAAQNHWIWNATVLLKTNLNFKNPEDELVVVCATPYDNVPQPTFWNGHRKTPAHAIGYLDGSTKLISPAEFRSLNLSGFIPASSLDVSAK